MRIIDIARFLVTSSIALVLAGCGTASESSLERDFRRGIEQINSTYDVKKLHAKLGRTLASIRDDHATSATAGRAKELARAGFAWTLKGLESQIAFHDNDSGNLPIAARDAARGYHRRLVGARLLRRAGRLLDVPVGDLGGYS